MKLSFHTSLGLPELPSDSPNKQRIIFACWANTYSVGSYKGVRDATPGLLCVTPYDPSVNYKNPTSSEVELMFQHSDRSVIFPFSIMNGGKPRAKWSVPGDIGVILDSISPITWPYNTTDTILDNFGAFDFDNTLKRLYTDGPMSIVIKSSDKLLSGVCTFVKEVKELFDYSHMVYYNTNKLSAKDLAKYGNAEFRMSFFKPSQCLPFFGENHGAVVHISVTQPKYSSAAGKFSPLIEMVGLFTDNTRAFVDVDGSGNIYGSAVPFAKIPKAMRDYSAAFDCVGGAAKATG